MSQTLDEFVKEAHEHIDRFNAWWLKNHRVAPDLFPFEMETGNKGLWWEQLMAFDED